MVPPWWHTINNPFLCVSCYSNYGDSGPTNKRTLSHCLCPNANARWHYYIVIHLFPCAHGPWGCAAENVMYIYEILVQPMDAFGHYVWRRYSDGYVPDTALSTYRVIYVAHVLPRGVKNNYDNECINV
ncbi:hypothetical protein MAR_018663 [Mya arenaria]|uniref:Uncharacterized protein n=1 Tax=Mya arenaria TaxID=6604 RepID=A0ABY7EFB3_MYAAR|nr:hypothetical protein MAR_018663 [Mya arenaria]